MSKESLGPSAQLVVLSLIQWLCVLGAVDAGLALRGSQPLPPETCTVVDSQPDRVYRTLKAGQDQRCRNSREARKESTRWCWHLFQKYSTKHNPL